MASRLSTQKSPYLLQHKENPVDWYPWGDEAFKDAERLDRPIFLSIGYSSCHWCHVMARESFENEGIAAVLNDNFISVKVDREERPDVDGVYMAACQMMTGSGGWPLTIIMTPQKEPFFADTYIPRETSAGRLGLADILPRIAKLWQKERGRVEESAVGIVQALREGSKQANITEPTLELLRLAYVDLSNVFDQQKGGFGVSPKFPVPHNLAFLLRWWKRTGDGTALMMVEKTLQAMRRGGIFDQIGFGFHRYSTDRDWLVPHFEKMLYDQALIILVCLESYQATHDPQYAGMAEETLEYMQRGLGAPMGGFYSGEDADSEHQEGLFYLWRMDEIESILGKEDGILAASIFEIEPTGNFKMEAGYRSNGLNILHLSVPLTEISVKIGMQPAALAVRLETIRKKLFDVRDRRIHPHRDEKILCDWNGLALAALSRASQVLGNKDYLERARQLCDFLLMSLRTDNGTLYHRFSDGEAAITGTIDDYAFLTWGLLELYEAGFETRYLKTALKITETMISHFWDIEAGGFFFTSDIAEKLLVRQKVVYDGALPSGNSVALMNLIKLARITASPELEEMAQRMALVFSGAVSSSPAMHTHFLCGLGFLLGPSREIVVAGSANTQSSNEMVKALRDNFFPDKVLIFKDTDDQSNTLPDLAPFIKDMNAPPGKTFAYVCDSNRCRAPVEGRTRLLELMGDAA